MTDLDLADLLGEAPRTPDPGFRFDVLSLASIRARRRAAFHRAVKQVIAFTLLGLSFPAAGALGLTWEHAAPLVLTIAITAFAYVLAVAAVQGPKPLLARSRAWLRAV